MIIPGTTLNRNGRPKVGFAVRLQLDEDSATATIVEITFHYPSDKPTPIFPGKSWDDLLSIHCPTWFPPKTANYIEGLVGSSQKEELQNDFDSAFHRLYATQLNEWLKSIQHKKIRECYGVTVTDLLSAFKSNAVANAVLDETLEGMGHVRILPLSQAAWLTTILLLHPSSNLAIASVEPGAQSGAEASSALVDPSVDTYSQLTEAETVPHSVEKAVYKDQQGTINIRGSDWKIHFVWYQEVNADNGETVPSDHFDLSIVRVGNQGEQVVFRGNSIADNRTALETELNTWISEEYSIVLLNESLRDSLNESNTPAYRGDALEREQDRMSTAETLREMTLKLQESAQPSGTWEAEWIWTVYFTGWHN
ncbi:hypothetical protein QFC19_006645 [Naganishia cerealis]|uniref:Uncharacterized protein n=1 Tax=Naganishia cerealis TaxID=610337 RepID=A0ACC2VEN4_9TREE|nr:hypothetical protein QFC19_006645 [Naganishia cerealis]